MFENKLYLEAYYFLTALSIYASKILIVAWSELIQDFNQGCLLRLQLLSMHSNVRKMSSPKWGRVKSLNDVTIILSLNSRNSDVVYGFIVNYLEVGDVIFRTFERFKSKQPVHSKPDVLSDRIENQKTVEYEDNAKAILV